MSHYHACVWIDHREAKIFGIVIDEADEATTPNAHATHLIHRKADHVGLGKAPLDHAFLKEIAEKLEPAQAILLTGPGQAKTELADYLKQHFPAIAARVWGIEPIDHPTDGELVATARKYFRAADRMHT